MSLRTDQTLLEQMHITHSEIQCRLHLVGLTDNHCTVLQQFAIPIEEKIEDIVEQFYIAQLLTDEIAILIGDADTLSRLKWAQRHYILDLFSGNYDREYVNNRLRIGLVHKRIGVEPMLYLSAISLLKELLYDVLQEIVIDHDVLQTSRTALDRLIYFDTTLVFDTYISSMIREIDAAKRKAEEYANSLEIKVAERTAQLEKLAKLDSLTGLYNQRAMRELFKREIGSAKRRQAKLALIYFDIDDFKKINDKNGHVKGDEVLKTLGSIIQSCVREVDIACRYGGDEFCIILPDANVQSASQICERVTQLFIDRFPAFSLSFGVVETGPEIFLDEENLIAEADKKMYQAKAIVGNYVKL